MICPECLEETRHYVWPKHESTSGKTEDLDCCENTDCRWTRRTDRETRKVIEELTGKEKQERIYADMDARAAKRLGIEVHDGYDLGYLGKKGLEESKIIHAFWGGIETAVCATSEKLLMAKAHLIAEKCDKQETLEKINCKRCLEMLS